MNVVGSTGARPTPAGVRPGLAQAVGANIPTGAGRVSVDDGPAPSGGTRWGGSGALTPRVDTFTRTPVPPERRDALVRQLTALRDELVAQAERAAKEPGQAKSLQDLLDEEFDSGLASYDSHKDRVRGADPYLKDADKAMVGLLYAKYEKKFGEGSPELAKVDRFANELATLRGIGALVETDEDKKAAAARDARREERAEAARTRAAAQEKAQAEHSTRIAGLESAIAEAARTPVDGDASAVTVGGVGGASEAPPTPA